MGKKSSKISKQHLLHYTIPNENRLYLFDVHTERLYCIPIFHKGKPFFFGELKTIVCPQRQCIVIIGGRQVDNNVRFKYTRNQTLIKALSSNLDNSVPLTIGGGSKENVPPINLENLEEIDVSMLENHIESGISLFAKIEKYDTNMALHASSFIGIIEFRDLKNLRCNVDQEDIN